MRRPSEPPPLGRLRLLYRWLGSTNDLGRALLAAGYPAGTVIVADEQQQGRGRQGRRWEAAPGSALLCSILLRLDWPVDRLPGLNMATVLAVADAVTDASGRPVALKWPNDIVVASPDGWLKLAGILIETSLAGDRLTGAILGIGINLSAHPASVPTATNLLAASGRLVERTVLLDGLLAALSAWLPQCEAVPATLVERWRERLITLGQPVQVTTADGTFTALAETVTADGALIVHTPDGQRHRLLAGDVTLSHARLTPGALERGGPTGC